MRVWDARVEAEVRVMRSVYRTTGRTNATTIKRLIAARWTMGETKG